MADLEPEAGVDVEQRVLRIDPQADEVLGRLGIGVAGLAAEALHGVVGDGLRHDDVAVLGPEEGDGPTLALRDRDFLDLAGLDRDRDERAIARADHHRAVVRQDGVDEALGVDGVGLPLGVDPECAVARRRGDDEPAVRGPSERLGGAVDPRLQAETERSGDDDCGKADAGGEHARE